jgi:hypothetical protein
VTIQGIRRVHITDVVADVENNRVALWRVGMKLTFGIQDRLHE